MRNLAPLASILAAVAVASDTKCSVSHRTRDSPSDAATVVDGNGYYDGSYGTIQEAVNSLMNASTQQTLFIFPGVYHEQVNIRKLNFPLVIQGYTCDTMSYDANTVTITFSKAQSDIPDSTSKNRNALTSTLAVHSDNVRVYNLNIANTGGNKGQALAAFVDGDQVGFYGCSLTGYQDTLCTNQGRHVFARSLIIGAIDFIFGHRATSWFEACTIETIGQGSITANGRDSESNPSIFVINNAKVYGKGVGQNFLGRPWKPFSRAVFQYCELSNVINSAGWQIWSKDNSNTDHVFFREFKNYGPGADIANRVSFSKTLDNPINTAEVLGDDYEEAFFFDNDFF